MIMWKVFMILGLPFFNLLAIAYGIMMNILGPLGMPDFLGLRTNM